MNSSEIEAFLAVVRSEIYLKLLNNYLYEINNQPRIKTLETKLDVRLIEIKGHFYKIK